MSNKLVTEREMDIAVLEAQAYADDLYESWRVEFVGRRAVLDLARRKKMNAQAQLADPAQQPPLMGGGYAQ